MSDNNININTPDIGPYTPLKPFRFWCQKVLPLVYDESLSYYELLCKVVDYLNKTMEDVDQMITDMGEFKDADTEFKQQVKETVEALEAFMNDYFDNLDVQDEINNKLDAMAEDGYFNTLFNTLFRSDVISAAQTVTAEWIAAHLLQEAGYVIDNSLTVENAAADAKAVGDRFANIDGVITEIEKITGKELNITDTVYAGITDGKFVNASNGSTSGTSVNYSRTVMINVEGYDFVKITLPVITAVTTSMGIAFYTSDTVSDFISGEFVTYNQPEVSYEERLVQIPPTAKYFRSSWFSEEGDFSELRSSFSCELIKTGEFQEVKETLTELDVTGNIYDGFVRPGGELNFTSTSYRRTGYIPVFSGFSYYYTGKLNVDTIIGGYDDKGIFVDSVLSNEATTTYTDELLTIPAGVSYIMACDQNSATFKIVTRNNTITNMEAQLNRLYKKETELSYPDMTSVSLFEKIGVIGDSFCSGAIYDIPGASNGSHYGISWPAIMGRLCGIECVPYASPGVNAHDYLTNANCLPKLLNETAKNLYLIMLGINEETTGTIADIHDDDYTLNADTFFGNMGKIYEQIKVHAPNAKIVFIKPPIGSPEHRTAIQDIADHYEVPVIDTLNDIYYHTAFYAANKGNGHPIGVSYAGMCQAMIRQLSECMITNVTYFANYTGND